MPTSVFLTTCLGIDSIPASRSNDSFVPIVATKSGESISCAIRENANFLPIEGPERGRLEIRIEPIAGRTPCHVNGEQVAEGALRSAGEHRALFSRSARLGGGGGGGGGWDDERHRDSAEEVSVSVDGCGPS